MIRPAQASGFYPKDSIELKASLESLFQQVEKSSYLHGIVPHAGYAYSGLAAASFYKSLKKTNSVIILGNDHYGNTIEISTHPYSEWETPLGKVQVDEDLTEELNLPVVESFKEHSIEVQLPFLQHKFPNISILPITVPPTSLEKLIEFGAELKKLKVPIIATTDFSHYISRSTASRLDTIAIEAILNGDPEELERVVSDHSISMCGLHPTLLIMSILRKKERELIMYYTSGEVTGDNSSVVGYASIGFK
ncbi:MAG: AmmeMemoRadiSam system protein B [Candidatus Altiarchaeota archaeon]|nr:AmmeMemoRadiSam system protein B [Candidatus Altiarchaeota archaeon]